MKLNLAPSKVKREGSLKGAWILSSLLVLLAAGASAFLAYTSGKSLDEAKARAESAKPNAAQAVAQAKLANEIVRSTAGIATNLELSRAMTAHNTKYTRFYRQVTPYVPGFMRVTNMRVSPISNTSASLVISGIAYSLQNHNDAQLALLRIPGAVAVQASGYSPRPVVVPNLTEEDQIGRPSRVGSTPPPEDPMERLNGIIATASAGTTGFENVGNYGTQSDFATRGALPTGSEVTYTITIDAAASGNPLPMGWDIDFLVPDPTKTLGAVASGGAGAGAGTGRPAGGGMSQPSGLSSPELKGGN